MQKRAPRHPFHAFYLNRRRALQGLAVAAALPLNGHAQDSYPVRPITIVVPWGPGGSGDITARTFSKYFEKRTGQVAVIENKPGANGILGSQYLKTANADGYTVMMTSNMTHGANTSLYRKLPYDPLRDFQHIGMFGVFGLLLLVPAGSPIKSFADLVAQARAKPDELALGHFNASTQISALLLKSMGAMPIKDVSYKAIGSAFTDLLGGHIQLVFADYPAASAQIAAGKLVPIAVTAGQRSSDYPQVPAIAEFIPGYEVITSLGLAAPANIPKAVVDRVNALIIDALADAEVRAQFLKLGYTLRPYSAEATRGFLVEETEKWARYIKLAKIEPQ